MVTSLLAAQTHVFVAFTGIGDKANVQTGKDVLGSELGAPITVFFAAIGTLLSVYAVVLILKALGKGKTGDAIKTAIGGIMIATLCFNLAFVNTFSNATGKAAKKAFSTITELWDKSESSPKQGPNYPTVP